MDCCGSSKPKEDKDVKENPTEKETGKDVKASHMDHGNKPTKEEQTHGGGGCCGGGGSGMWLHLIIMLILFIAIWYFSKR